MNIFYLDESPTLAARAHCDKHVNKMAFEGAQMLSTACFQMLPGRITQPQEHLLYAPTHVNHPCNKWVRKSYANFRWLSALVDALDNEHFKRYGTFTDHGVVNSVALELMRVNAPVWYLNATETPPAQAMPLSLHLPTDPIKAYRNYYKQHKAGIAKWERGVNPPEWW